MPDAIDAVEFERGRGNVALREVDAGDESAHDEQMSGLRVT